MINEVLIRAKREHRKLDTKIKKMAKRPTACQFMLGELKKQKLRLKERIHQLTRESSSQFSHERVTTQPDDSFFEGDAGSELAA